MTPRAEEPNDRVDQAVSRILDRVELEEPPKDLKPNVLRAIGTRPGPARSGWFETLRAGFRRGFVPQLYPFAAGAAVGVVAFAILSGVAGRHGIGEGPVDGVMAPAAPGIVGERGHAAVKVDDQSFELGRANVRFEVFRSGDRAAVSVSADAAEPVLVTIQTPGGVEVDQVMTVPSAAGSVEYGTGWVRIWQSHRDRAQIGLKAGTGDSAIQIVITARGQSIQGSLHTGGVPSQAAQRGGR